MTKIISVKELRTKFPRIRRELKRGVNFQVIYRSKPIARITPEELKPTPKESVLFWAHPPKEWLIKTKKSAVEIVREQRGDR